MVAMHCTSLRSAASWRSLPLTPDAGDATGRLAVCTRRALPPTWAAARRGAGNGGLKQARYGKGCRRITRKSPYLPVEWPKVRATVSYTRDRRPVQREQGTRSRAGRLAASDSFPWAGAPRRAPAARCPLAVNWSFCNVQVSSVPRLSATRWNRIPVPTAVGKIGICHPADTCLGVLNECIRACGQQHTKRWPMPSLVAWSPSRRRGDR